MKKDIKLKILLHKTYFDIGYGESSYIKYGIAVFGVSSQIVQKTMIAFGIYGILCYIFGFLYIKYGWLEAKTEIGNLNNKFVKEVRKSLSGGKIYKADNLKIIE